MHCASAMSFFGKGRSFAATTAFIFSAAFLLSGLIASQASADTPVQIVAISGSHAPGTASSVTFSQFLSTQAFSPTGVPPSINAQGQVNFYGALTGPNVISGLNDLGLWSGAPGNTSLVARIDKTLPASLAGSFSSFTPPPTTSIPPLIPVPINANNQLAFDAFLIGAGVGSFNDEGLWTGTAKNTANFAREGSQVPGQSPGVQYLSYVGPAFGSPYLNDAGHVEFGTSITGAGTVIMAGDPSAPQVVAQVGQQAPGTGPGITFAPSASFGSQPITFTPVALGANDQVTFTAGLQGPGTSSSFGGIWSGTPGNINLVARIGDQAPGLASGITFQSQTLGNPFGNIDANGAGQVAFASNTVNQTFTTFGSGIWAGTAGHLGLVAAGGAQAPGMPSGTLFSRDAFSNFSSATVPVGPLENSQGQVVFGASVDKSAQLTHTGFGLWAGSPDQLRLVAQAGQQVPGVPSLTITDFFINPLTTSYPTLAINAAGQVAFAADLSNGSVGIFGTDRAGQLQEVIRPGDTIQVAPGDFRTVTAVSFLGGSGNADGRPSGLSDNGSIAFWAAYSGGSGIFVSNALAVPEPSSLLLVAMGALGVAIAVQRRMPF